MGGAIGAIGGAVVSGVLGSKKAKTEAKAEEKASEAELQATRENIEFQREVFEQQREDIAPWREAGEFALQRLRKGIDAGTFDPGRFRFQFQKDPGYEFRLQEGIDALDTSAAARGRLFSGAQAKALTRYGQDFAANEYQNAYLRALQEHEMERARREGQFNRYASLAGVGQQATRDIGSARSQMAQQVGASTLAGGRSMAEGIRGSGEARASGYGDLASTVNRGIENYYLYSELF